jgi:hypothetical protein
MRPASSTDDQAHLMVQCMEAWFLADKEVLGEFFDQGFLVGSLPGHANIEEVLKDDLLARLEQASRRTQKGRYHKTKHGFALLTLIDPERVAAASLRASRLFDVLVREVNR